MYNILICDNDRDIVAALKIYLTAEGYHTFEAYNGREALDILSRETVHLALLDIMMPGMDGLSATTALREKSNIPVILLTAKSEDADKVLGLSIGADDYVVKPFSPREVMTRIKAVLRRVSDEANDERNKRIEVAGLTIDMNSYEAYVNGKPVVLTKKEIEILWLFATNPGKVYTRDHLLENIWGYEYFGDTRTVDTHIKRIRTKLTLDETVGFDIKTLWGVGYKSEAKQ